MAKSVLHAAVGVLVGEGRLRLDEPAGRPGWDDDRSAITLDHLLQMRDGLRVGWRTTSTTACRT